jgi:hypothetical protein
MVRQPVSHSRRFTARVDTPEGVWVDWRCAGREDISQVRNLSFVDLLQKIVEIWLTGETFDR